MSFAARRAASLLTLLTLLPLEMPGPGSHGLAAEAGGPNGPAFSAGESLQYSIHWGPVRAGSATLSVPGTLPCAGGRCLILESRAWSTGFLRFLFPVRDTITSHFDLEHGRTLYSAKELHEGNYHRYATAHFEPATRTARWTLRAFAGNTEVPGERRKDARWKRRAGRAENLPPRVLDMLSALYSMRSSPISGKPGTSFAMRVFDDGKLTILRMDILRREEVHLNVNDRRRSFPALVVRPVIRTSGIFRAKGETQIWISDDARRWPLIVASEITLGTITVRLKGTRDANGML